MISIIVPMLNEASSIEATLQRLQPLRDLGHEVIVVDGGSSDGSVESALPYADQVVVVERLVERGRANQMNRGAQMASGRLLLFLHADTLMTATACRFLSDLSDSNPNLFAQDAQGHPYYWGFFRITLSGRRAVFRLIERLITVRSRITSVATGDQAMFVSRALFEEVGGFPSMLLMEDVALSKRLRKRVRPICSGLASVETSSRRWESKGVLATVLMMWGLRFAYWMKMSPDLLAKFYR